VVGGTGGMSTREEDSAALAPTRTAALSMAGVSSLAARGRADLRNIEEAEESRKRGKELCRREAKYEEAFECFQRAIELDPSNAETQCWLGWSFYFGLGVVRDYERAALWFRRAAERGQVDALWNLGYCYEVGYGVPQDDAQADFWYGKAAEQGVVPYDALLRILAGAFPIRQSQPHI
jgi:tetratricopeptide (TPR) repeat protein